MIVSRIATYIETEQLILPSDKILVALSGGADSVALLRLLTTLGYHCEAAHCNFHLRQEESNRDECFVRKLCQELKIKLHTTDFQTAEYAKEKSLSIEMAARELRYEWFDQLLRVHKMDCVAVGHHKDDSIETLLLNLIRGTGISGLLGISPRKGAVVRPLLCVNRKEIIDYLSEIKQPYVTDSTNLQDEYTRNKIRLNIIPLMQEINPSFKDGLSETIRHLNEAALLYEYGIEQGKERVFSPQKGINIDLLIQEPSPQTLLFEILHPLGFNSSQIKAIELSLHGQPGKLFLSKEWRVIKDRTHLLIEPLNPNIPKNPPFELIQETCAYYPEFVIPRNKEVACFDADKLHGTMELRLWRAGDVFVPFGMTGQKRVSDFLTDRKFSVSQKEQQWVLCCDDKIAWIVGERTDNRFRIDHSTQKVIIFSIRPTSQKEEEER